MKVNNIVIVGGGSSGWMTAATLNKAFPEKTITVIESKDIPTIGVGESTIVGIRRWAKYIGLNDETFFKQTDATYKLSVKLTDFYKKDSGGFHYPFGAPMVDGDRNPFFDWELKRYLDKETTTQDFVNSLFPSSALMEENKISLNENGEFDNFNPDEDIAYHFNAVKFAIWLRDEFCVPKGVKHIVSTVTKVNTDESGVSSLVLEDGSVVTADLYVDCTGFKSLLLGGALNETFDSYEDMLPNNRAWAAPVEYIDAEKEMQPYTNCTAIENGWCWNTPLWSRLGTGYVYSDKYATPEEAKEEFKKYLMSDKMVIPRTKEYVDSLEFRDLKFRVGIYRRTFVKNVVAIGLSAAFIEPLESNGLFSVYEFLFKLMDILRRGDINEFDRGMYNVSVRDQFDGFTKFVALHYALSHRDDTAYWQAIQNRVFTDRHGDPDFQYIGREDAFFNMSWRYMRAWEHVLGRQGITYIAVGMQVHMMNDFRYWAISSQNKDRNLEKEIEEVSAIWGARKFKWAQNAKLAPTMRQYLKENFHDKT